MKRTKRAQVKRKMKSKQSVKSAKKTQPRPKLSDQKAILSGLRNLKQFRAKLRDLHKSELLYVLSQLNIIIDTQRLAWIQASNLRDRIRRGRV